MSTPRRPRAAVKRTPEDARQEAYAEVIKVLKEKNQDDPNLLFGQYVGTTLQEMAKRPREMAKLEIQQVLVKYLFENMNE